MVARVRSAPPEGAAQGAVRVHRELGSISATRAAEVLTTCATVIDAEVRNAAPALRFMEGFDRDDLYALARIAALESSLTFVVGRCAFTTWASRVIRWRLLEAVRSAQRPPGALELDAPCIARAEFGVSELGVGTLEPLGASHAPEALVLDPADEQDRDERVRWLVTALGALSPRRRALVVAKLRGESGQELSAMLGVSDGRISQEVRVAVDALHAAAVDAGLTDG